MPSADQLLLRYEAIGALSAGMLSAAGENDWDRVALLEHECASHVRALRETDVDIEWESAERVRKAALIRQILDDDRRIRELATPWMARLSELINTSRTQSRVAMAYGAV